METFVPSSFRPGIHKSWAPGHRGLQISLLWRIKFWVFATELASCHPPGAYNFEMAPVKNLWTPNRVLQALIRSRDRSIVIHETKMMAHTFLRGTRTRNLVVEFKNVPWTLSWVDLNCCSTNSPPPSPEWKGYTCDDMKGKRNRKEAIQITQHNKINEFQ